MKKHKGGELLQNILSKQISKINRKYDTYNQDFFLENYNPEEILHQIRSFFTRKFEINYSTILRQIANYRDMDYEET